MPQEKDELKTENTADGATTLVAEELQPELPAPEPGVGEAGPSGSPREASPAGEPVSREEFEKVKAERDQLLDRLARLQAEFENARKRSERERGEFRDYATGNVVEQFLPVLDNFALALKSTGSAEQLRSGVELIVKQMDDVLRQLQVVPVATVGEAFDPRLHEALGTVERDDLPDQHVAEEVRRGYKLRERLLRPAMVRIVSNPKQKSE
jgi:molecular chaperone GrpE